MIEHRLAEVDDIVKRHAAKGARMYPRAGIDDLIQEGRIAAWKALAKWDPNGGKSWRTYAGWTIRLQIMKAAWEQGNTVVPRFATVVATLAKTGEGTMPPQMRSLDDPNARGLAVTPREHTTPEQVWAVTASLKRAKAAHVLSYLLHHRLGLTFVQVGAELDTSKNTAMTYESLARREIRARAADLEWRARPGTCPGWGTGQHIHLAPIPSLGLCPNCWGAINQAARGRARRAA